jgi:hypothetical protein
MKTLLSLVILLETSPQPLSKREGLEPLLNKGINTISKF